MIKLLLKVKIDSAEIYGCAKLLKAITFQYFSTCMMKYIFNIWAFAMSGTIISTEQPLIKVCFHHFFPLEEYLIITMQSIQWTWFYFCNFFDDAVGTYIIYYHLYV